MMLFMNEPLLEKELFLCLAHFISPEAPYAGVIRRSAIRASQVLGFLANQARYGTVFWQVGHLQSSFSRSHSRSDRPKKKKKKSLLIFPKEWVMDLFLFFLTGWVKVLRTVSVGDFCQKRIFQPQIRWVLYVFFFKITNMLI